jgi:hypothetical protein
MYHKHIRLHIFEENKKNSQNQRTKKPTKQTQPPQSN